MFSSHPLSRRFPNDLMLCGQHIEWTTRGRDFFCRPEESPIQTVWCQPGHPQIPSSFQHIKRQQSTRSVLLPEFEKRSIWRFVALEDGREFLLSLDFALMRHEGANFWLRLEWQDALFHDIDELLFGKIKPSIRIDDRLQDGTKDWKLAEQCRQGDWWSRLESSQGSIEQLRKLVEAYALIWDNPVRSQSVKDLRLQTVLQMPVKKAIPEKQSAAQKVGELLDRHFRLRVKDLAERIYGESAKSVERAELGINPSPQLTEHERMEALGTWREFLHGKMTPEEIEAFLPKS